MFFFAGSPEPLQATHIIGSIIAGFTIKEEAMIFTIEQLSKLFSPAKAWILLLVASLPVAAAEIQSLSSIRMQAEAFISQHPYESPYAPGFQLGNLDSRLRLKPCPEALAIDFSRRDVIQGNTALSIRCARKPGWKIHLPVRIDIYDDVLVTAKPLVKGQIIDESSVMHKKTNISRLNNGYFAKDAALAELQARRNLARGTVLSSKNLVPRLLVHSGQQVTLVLEFKGVQIKASGKALRSASRGERVKVRNNQSRKIVEGIVSGEAMVRVNI
jgi:flagella basal body P-ring formation protein FlgA